MGEYESQLQERYGKVMDRVCDAARQAERDPSDVALIAVSKFHPPEAIRALAACGHTLFGESYVQEARAKKAALSDLDIAWHLIGRIQSNKAKDAAAQFSLLHGIDSERLAEAVSARIPDGVTQKVLIQVNIGREPQKAGVLPEGLNALGEAVCAMPGLELVGLMCMAPLAAEGEMARPFFASLRESRDRLATRLGVALPCLSMGMSGDFEYAISEGATLVRIGTDIFGQRP